MNTQSFLPLLALALVTVACEGTVSSEREDAEEASESALEATPSASPREILDVSKNVCTKTHPLVGRDLPLTSRAHGVSGVVRIVDDCTLVLSDFNYDGRGRKVELYGSTGGSFARGVSLSADLLRPSKAYTGAQLFLRLPSSVKLRDLDGLSVWCADVNVSFGDVSFR